MDNLFLSLVLTLIAASVWVIPSLYVAIAGIILTAYVGYIGEVARSSAVIIFILAFVSYRFKERYGDKNTILRLEILVLIIWALFNSGYEGKVITWLGNLELPAKHQKFVAYLNFEEIMAAIILAAFLCRPRKTWEYWKNIFVSSFSILFLLYVVLLLPLAWMMHTVFKLDLNDLDLKLLILNVFLLAFTKEVIFRGVLQKWLAQIIRIKVGANSSAVAIIVIGIFYGLFESLYHSIIFAVLGMFMGIIYGYIYNKSGKIEVAILAHIAGSLTFFLMMAYYGHGNYLPIVIK